MILGITDTLKPSLQVYVEWIQKVTPVADIITLSCVQSNLDDLDRCNGVVLTGGGDIHPKFYGREDATSLVHSVNEVRDEFEFAVVTRAIEKNLPILGICRGMQVCNVALGGTMIPDVQVKGYQNHGKGKTTALDPRHCVQIQQGTLFSSIIGMGKGDVNTNHHQAVDRLGRGLRATAWSPDGLVEGLEWEQPAGKAFLELVQWHPERMTDFESPLSKGLLEYFICEVQTSKKLQVSS